MMLKNVYYTIMQKLPQANDFSSWFLYEHYTYGVDYRHSPKVPQQMKPMGIICVSL